jgi:hypothetical protein
MKPFCFCIKPFAPSRHYIELWPNLFELKASRFAAGRMLRGFRRRIFGLPGNRSRQAQWLSEPGRNLVELSILPGELSELRFVMLLFRRIKGRLRCRAMMNDRRY